MTVSDNTRSHDSRRWEELYQQLQQAVDEFKEQQNQVNDQIRELITGLSRQVLQIATDAAMGEVSLGNSNQPYSRLSRIEFPRFLGVRMCWDGYISVSNFLRWIILLIMYE